MLSNFLNREYYFPVSFSSRIIIATGNGLTILLILLLFTPFGMENIQTFPERFLVASGYSFIAFAVWLAALGGIGVFKINTIRFFHILFFIVVIGFIIGSLSTIYNNIIFSNPYYFEFFLDIQFAVYLTGIIPTIMLILLLETTFYEKISPDFKIDPLQSIGKKDRIQVTIEDENPDKSIRLFSDEILHISSMDNYIQIALQNDGKKHKDVILRSTLKSVEKNFSNSDAIVRCHRSHIVNLRWVKEISGNAMAKKCIMDIGNDIIPISRSKADAILRKFRELS